MIKNFKEEQVPDTDQFTDDEIAEQFWKLAHEVCQAQLHEVLNLMKTHRPDLAKRLTAELQATVSVS